MIFFCFVAAAASVLLIENFFPNSFISRRQFAFFLLLAAPSLASHNNLTINSCSSIDVMAVRWEFISFQLGYFSRFIVLFPVVPSRSCRFCRSCRFTSKPTPLFAYFSTAFVCNRFFKPHCTFSLNRLGGSEPVVNGPFHFVSHQTAYYAIQIIRSFFPFQLQITTFVRNGQLSNGRWLFGILESMFLS